MIFPPNLVEGRSLKTRYPLEFGRPKRVVKYKRGYDMWTYVAGEKRLPGASYASCTDIATRTLLCSDSSMELMVDTYQGATTDH